MRKISIWAKRHPWPARMMIVVSFILLNVLGFTAGLLLRDAGINLPLAAMLFFASLYAVGFIAWPFINKNRQTRMTRRDYVRQKTCDLLLAASTYLMVIFCGNHQEILFRNSIPVGQVLASNTILPKDNVSRIPKTIAAFYGSMKDVNGKMLSWKERKKLLKVQVKAIKKANDMSSGAKTALIILSVIVALGLLYLVAALSCTLSCNGSGALAVIVALGGGALVVFLLIMVIRNILGVKKRKKEPDVEKKAI